MPLAYSSAATWPRDTSFTLSPIPTLDRFFPSHYPGIFVLLHIASDGAETVIRVAHSNDVCSTIDLECVNPRIIPHGPTHAAVQFSPTETPGSDLTRRVDTAYYHQRFQPVA